MAAPQFPESMTVSEYIQVLRSSRADYARFWEGLTTEQMTRRPGPQEDWSIKDLIGHLCWWESYSIARVMLMRSGATLPRMDDFDALNAQVFNAWKGLSLDFVLGEWENNRVKIETYVQTLSDQEFNATDPLDGRTPFRLMGGNTVGHYLDHQADLERYVNNLRA